MSFALSNGHARLIENTEYEPINEAVNPVYPPWYKGIDVAHRVLSLVGVSLESGDGRKQPEIRRVLVGGEMRGAIGGLNVFEPVRSSLYAGTEGDIGRIGRALGDFNSEFFSWLGIRPKGVSVDEWPDTTQSFKHPFYSAAKEGLQLAWHKPQVVMDIEDLDPAERKFFDPEMFTYDFRCIALTPRAVEDVEGTVIMPIEARIQSE